MEIKHIPVFIIGLFLTLISLEVAFAPDAILITPAHEIVFDAVGRGPLAIALAVTGLWTIWDGIKGSLTMTGLFFGVLNSTFWFVTTLLPLWFGHEQVDIFWWTAHGAINAVSTLAWLLISTLGGYYYVTARQGLTKDLLLDKALLDEIRRENRKRIKNVQT